MKKWGQVFVLTGSIVAMLITGTGCSKKNTGIKNEKLASDYMELFNMSEGIKTEEGCFKIRDGICYYVDFGEEICIFSHMETGCMKLRKMKMERF